MLKTLAHKLYLRSRKRKLVAAMQNNYRVGAHQKDRGIASISNVSGQKLLLDRPTKENWSNRLVKAFLPKFVRSRENLRIVDLHMALKGRNQLEAGDPHEQYAQWLDKNFGVKKLLFDELWGLANEENIELPFPGSHNRRIRWQRPQSSRYENDLATLGHYFDTLIYTSRLSVGGADKVVRSMYNALAAVGKSPLIIVSEYCDEESIENEGLSWISLNSPDTPNLNFERKKQLIEFTLGYTQPAALFIVNCSVMHRVLIESGLNYSGPIYYGLWPRWRSSSGTYKGYFLDLPYLEPHVTAFFTDNGEMAAWLVENGIGESRVRQLRMPVTQEGSARQTRGSGVLWASRLDYEKRPELLLDIAEICSDIDFAVFGEHVLGESEFLEKAQSRANIHYHGSFSDFGKIATPDLGIYLYTSHFDGMPNVVLEAMKSGMAVIGSAVGGVPDVLSDGRGIAISDLDDPIAYASAVRFLRADHVKKTAMSTLAKSFVDENYDVDQFSSSISAMIEEPIASG